MNSSRLANKILLMVGFLIFSLTFIQMVKGQEVTKIQSNQPLNERWDIATSLAKQKDYSKGYWIGYCISKMMEKNSFIGSYDTRKRNAPTLFETIYGMKNESEPGPDITGDCCSMSGFISIGNRDHTKIQKKIALLVQMDANGSQVEEVKTSNMSLHVDLKNKPVIWMESATDNESVSLLKSLFNKTNDVETEKEFVSAIAFHQSSTKVISFLTSIVSGDYDNDVREDAVFWIGQQETDSVLPFLTKVARTDHTEDVREKAIFSISQIESEAAVDSLISLSRKGHDNDMRSKAMFWLAQKASDKAVKALKGVIEDDDEDSDVQKQALFALTQSDDKNEGVNELIEIAKSHHNPKIRKEAIFWLGQSDDPKAIDALVEIVKR